MQAKSSIIKNQALLSPLATLRAGDSVLVWDNVEGRNVWLEIADIVERDGRWKIRVEGSDFYFDQNLVVNFIKGREIENPGAFPVFVLSTESGTIGSFDLVSSCPQCKQPSGHLFNVGTATDLIQVCYECRRPSNPRAFIGQTYVHLRVTAIACLTEDYLLLRCQCFCRAICNVKSYDLVSGRIISCNRCAKERAA